MRRIETVKPRKPRARSEKARQAILQSALVLLDEEGYGALSIEAIAQRAGVGKTTVYRWWRSKAEVVLEAYTETKARHVTVPPGKNLRDDLERFMRKVFRALRQKGSASAMSALMAEAQRDPAFGTLLRTRFIAQRREAVRAILVRRQAQKEIHPTVDLDIVIDCLYGPMWYRLLNGHAPLNDVFAKHLVQQVLSGVCGGSQCEIVDSLFIREASRAPSDERR